MTNADYNDGNSTAYYYDKLGSRTSVINGGTVDYNSNSLNQYTSVGGTDYEYDKNGNLTYGGSLFDFQKYSYDCENRLYKVKRGRFIKVEYSYDFAGRRVKKTTYYLGDPNVITKYCYDGDQVIAEYEDDVLVRKFVYGPGIDEPIMMIDVSQSKTYYYHYDGLGSVIALSDSSANIVEEYSYDVFGAATIRDTLHEIRAFTAIPICSPAAGMMMRLGYTITDSDTTIPKSADSCRQIRLDTMIR